MSLQQGIERLETLMKKALAEEAFPGISYTIVTKDRTFNNHLGDRAWFPEREALPDRTIYDLASLSKVVSTTTSILMLIERGELRLVDPVSSILDEFKHKDVRIFHLLTHSSGLPADIPNARLLKSPEEVKAKAFAMDLTHPVGEKIVYSDIGYILLGLIVQKLSGKTLDQFAKENIFEPLEMVDTAYNPEDIERCAPTELREDPVYQGYLKGRVHDEKAYALEGVAGHAGVFSTAYDLSHFIQMILNDGVYNGKRILSKATLDRLFTKQVIEEKFAFGQPYVRTFGWELPSFGYSCGDLVSPKTIYHTGFTGTCLIIDRDNQVGMAFLTNHVHPKRGKSALFSYRQKFANIVLSQIVPYL